MSEEEMTALKKHAKMIGGEKGIDKTLADYNIDVILAPADSLVITLASASGKYYLSTELLPLI